MLTLSPWRKAYSPAEERTLSSLRRDIDPFFAPFFGDGFLGSAGDPLRIDVRETEDAYIVRAEVPGLDPKDLDVQLQGDELVLAGEKPEDPRDERETCTYSERRYGSFRRVLHLAMPVDPERVTAEHRNGIVTIRLEKSAAAKPKRIQVSRG